VIGVLAAALLIVSAASAQEPTPTPASRPTADDVNRVASKLYCLANCDSDPPQLLNVCQTNACTQWKAQIAQYLAEGKTEDEIVQVFVSRFGDQVSVERTSKLDSVSRVAARLHCPVCCQNQPLQLCQTPMCVQWKEQIEQLLAEGKSEDEVVQTFVGRYGPRVLGDLPPPANPPTDDDVIRVASRLYCPVCENEPLDVCQTSACVQWKAQVRQFLAVGRTDDEITSIFADCYGLRVLAEPPISGTTLILWIGPIIVAIVGGFYSIRLIQRMSRRGATAAAEPVPSPSTSDEYRDQVERDIEQRF
jgi:cytochrome c-type biogenesis protein CcmH